MHYGGKAFGAIDKETNKLVEVNKELSPLDIEKLNHYYPAICKLMIHKL